MKKMFIYLTISCFTLGCQPKISNTSSVDVIIKSYLDAIGGMQNLKKIQTLIKKGHYIEPAYNIVLSSQVIQKRPNYRVIGDVDLNGFEEGYNGVAWEYHKGRGLTLSGGEAEEAILVGAEFDYPFIDASQKGNRLNLIGSQVIGGVEVFELETIVPMKNAEYITSFFFDINSGLLIAQSKTMPIHARGADVNIMVYFSDYKWVNNVLFPYSQIEREVQSGKFLNATIWSEIIANSEVKMSEFDPPLIN